MRKSHVTAGVMLLVATVFVVGCAKPPQQEIDAAQAALAAADQAEAPMYASAAWDKAQQAMNAVNAELEAQNAKFALFRSYTKAKQLIVEATNTASEAKDAGVAGKEKAKNEALAAVDAAKASIEAATQAMTELQACRRKPKDMKKDLEMMQGNLDGFAAQVGDLDGAFGREDFFGAKSQAETLKGQVDRMIEELQSAKTKIRC